MPSYSRREEILNIWSHGFGVVLTFIGFLLLVAKSTEPLYSLTGAAITIYCLTLLLSFLTSTLYHYSMDPQRKALLKFWDHIAIYYTIAGGYTPFALLLLPETLGSNVLILAWGAAVIGTYFKFRAYSNQTGKTFSRLSLFVYLAMGWSGLLIINQLYELLPLGGFMWLLSSALCYTVGTIFYAQKSKEFTHAIWHIFVLAGGICSFISIYLYLI